MVGDEIKGKYLIIDLNRMEAMKGVNGLIRAYDTVEEASRVCGMYEFEDVWICKLESNYKDNQNKEG
jgi:hypothetical protein